MYNYDSIHYINIRVATNRQCSEEQKGFVMNTNYDFSDFETNSTFAAEGSSESSGTREMSAIEKGCLIAATAATVAVAGALVYGSVKTFKYL